MMKLFALLFTTFANPVLFVCCSSSGTMVVASTQLYGGTYRFTKIYDNTVGEVPIPNDGIYTIQMRPSSSIVNQYDIGIKVGNSMGGSATITPSGNHGIEDQISIGGLRSTMMMPPPDLYRIEVALSDLLPSSTTIQIDDDVLTINGTKGSVQAARQNVN